MPTRDPAAGGTGGAAGSAGAAGTETSGAGGGAMEGNGADGADGNGADGNGVVHLELADGQIAGVMMVANAGEIEHGGIAVERAQDEDVREFAMRMVDEHGAATMRMDELLASIAVTSMVSPLSQQLMTASTQTTADLQQRSGAIFDLTYMQVQQAVHAQMLEIIDNILLPDVDDRMLRAEIEQMRMAMSSHLDEADDVLEDLQGPE